MHKTKKAPAENWGSEVPTETENLKQLFGMQNVETSAVHHLVLQKCNRQEEAKVAPSQLSEGV